MTMSMIQFAAGRKNIGGSGRFLEQRYWDLQLFAYPTLDLHLPQMPVEAWMGHSTGRLETNHRGAHEGENQWTRWTGLASRVLFHYPWLNPSSCAKFQVGTK